MKMKKRWKAGMFVLVAGMLAGCGKQDVEMDSLVLRDEAVARGVQKYREQTIDVPLNDTSFAGMMMKEDGLHVYYADKSAAFLDAVMSTNGEESSQEIAWVSDVLARDSIFLVDYKEAVDGTQYLCYQEQEQCRVEIYRKEEQISDFSLADVPGGIEILEDGNIFLAYDTTGTVVGEDGSEICSFPKGSAPSMLSQAFDSYQNMIVCQNEARDGVTIYDVKEQTTGNISYDFDTDEDVMIRFNNAGDIYILDRKGIHMAGVTDNSFTTILDGKDSKLSMYDVLNATISSDGKIWYVMKDYTTGKAFLCLSALTVVNEEDSDKQLTIYTLQYSDWLTQLALDFQEANPGYTVSVVCDGGDTMTTQDQIRNLHVKLLNENGPDILILDGLPVDSYIQKGILQDISDVMNGEVSEDLLPNIKADYQTAQGTFAIPTRMGIPFALSKQISLSELDSLKGLEAALQSGKKVFPETEPNSLPELLPVLYYNELMPDGTLSTEQLESLLSCMSMIKNQLGVTPEDTFAMEHVKDNDFGMTLTPRASWAEDFFYSLYLDDTLLAVREWDDIPMVPSGIADLLQQDLTSFGNAYIPYAQMGVSKNSSKIEASKQFIAFALSKSEQEIYPGDGFPVTKSGLAAWSQIENTHTSMEFDDPNGKTIMIEWPNKERRDKILETCANADQRICTQKIILEMLTDTCAQLMKGEVNEQEALSAITGKMQTYQEEQQ